MFSFFVTIFDVVLYHPLFNFLVLIYHYVPRQDFGVAIIIVTLAIRFLLYPIAVKALQSQMALQKLQPKLLEIQKTYKHDKEKQARETLDLYRKEKVNPFSGILMALIQLPILIALYRVFWRGFTSEELSYLYSFIANPGHINPMFLGTFDLSEPNIILAVGAGVLQFFQTKMLLPGASSATKTEGVAPVIQKQMVYLFPVITVIFLFRLPSALGLYWMVSGAFSIAQQYIIFKKRDSLDKKHD